MKMLSVIAIILFSFSSYQSQCNTHTNFYNFKNACDKLPTFQVNQSNEYKFFLNEKDFEAELEGFFETANNQFNKINWINNKPVVKSSDFQAFVEKIIIPTNSIVAIHGDIHGDVHSLNKFIETFVDKGFLDKDNPFKIKNKNFYILFLGDYVDRGWYGSEVIYAVLRLKNENPDHVFMVRGNHEDMNLNCRYGFAREVKRKFSSNNLLGVLQQFYNCLPLAIYLGSGSENNYNFVQCCHGGIEIGFNPKDLLESCNARVGVIINKLMQENSFNKVCCPEIKSFKRYFVNNKDVTSYNGFMWNDFIVDPNQILKLSVRDRHRGTMFEFGQSITKELLKLWSGNTYKVLSIFRAHQHGDSDMRNRILNLDQLSHPNDIGIGKLWIQNSVHKDNAGLLDNVPVVTFSVAPATGYGWPIHAFGQLNMAPNYSDWRLNVLQSN